MNTHIHFLIGLISGLVIGGAVGVYFYRRLDTEWSRASASFDLCTACITLERLRSGQIEGAIKVNEHLLNSGVMGLARQLRVIVPKRRSPDDVHWLRRAREYRAKFPRTGGVPEVDAAVTQAFALVDE
jgi:hypothetical protein